MYNLLLCQHIDHLALDCDPRLLKRPRSCFVGGVENKCESSRGNVPGVDHVDLAKLSEHVPKVSLQQNSHSNCVMDLLAFAEQSMRVLRGATSDVSCGNPLI